MQQISILRLLALCLIIGLYSCDNFQEDSLPPIEANSQQKYIVSGGATVIDLLADNKFGTDAIISVVNQPTKGKLQILESGKALYTPDADFTTGKDFFSYQVTANGQTEIGQIDINSVADSTGLPCGNLVVSDFICIDSNGFVGPSIIDVLRNDSLCAGFLDFSSLAIVHDPTYGTASIVNGQIEYTPDFNLVNANGATFDFIIYEVSSGGNNPETYYAAVIIQFKDCQASCIINAVDDFAHINNTANGVSQLIDVFANDISCNSLDTTTFVLLSPPTNGTVSYTGVGSYIYNANPGYEGSDSFVYQFCDFNTQDCTSATVTLDITLDTNICQSTANMDSLVLSVSSSPNAINQLSQAQLDSFNLTTSNFISPLNVKANDQICSGDILSIQSPITQSEGRVVSLWGSLYYIHEPNFFGSTEFTYKVCDANGGNCSSTVVVEIWVEQ